MVQLVLPFIAQGLNRMGLADDYCRDTFVEFADFSNLWFKLSGILYPGLARPMQKLAENSRLKCLAVVTSPAMVLLAPMPYLPGSGLRRIFEGAHFARNFFFRFQLN